MTARRDASPAQGHAELERGRAIAGHPADQEPSAELREDRTLRKKKAG
jgi:hypothetical protein